MGSIDEQLEQLSGGESSDRYVRVREGLEGLRAELVTDTSDSYPPPMLINQLNYLRGMTSSADQAPGNHAYDRFDELKAEVERLSAALDGLRAQAEEVAEEM